MMLHVRRHITPFCFMMFCVFSFLISCKSGPQKSKKLDERITLRKKDKIPYGTYVAYENLQGLFPNAKILVNKVDEPGYWDSLSNYDDGQALIIVTKVFQASEYEMKRLIQFVEYGNDVFISAIHLSTAVEDALDCSSNSFAMAYLSSFLPDSLHLYLNGPPFEKELQFEYPGKTYQTYFDRLDSNKCEVLGTDVSGRANFIRMRAGKGHLYVQLEPLAFSNYFLLHKNNISYYEHAMSLISPDTRKVVWDEYFLNKRTTVQHPGNNSSDDEKSWLTVLMQTENASGNHSFRAAIWTLLLLLLFYVLMEMRRKHGYIPVITKPRNDSLDFVKTIGRLYHDKGDHPNLCRKMSAYFLEHVRNRYKIPTGNLDENFIRQLQFKSGVNESELNSIVSFIRFAEQTHSVSPWQLAEFHNQLESFYSKA